MKISTFVTVAALTFSSGFLFAKPVVLTGTQGAMTETGSVPKDANKIHQGTVVTHNARKHLALTHQKKIARGAVSTHKPVTKNGTAKKGNKVGQVKINKSSTGKI